jgi:hypothetical protein
MGATRSAQEGDEKCVRNCVQNASQFLLVKRSEHSFVRLENGGNIFKCNLEK